VKNQCYKKQKAVGLIYHTPDIATGGFESDMNQPVCQPDANYEPENCEEHFLPMER